jgi:hypothetical protein
MVCRDTMDIRARQVDTRSTETISRNLRGLDVLRGSIGSTVELDYQAYGAISACGHACLGPRISVTGKLARVDGDVSVSIVCLMDGGYELTVPVIGNDACLVSAAIEKPDALSATGRKTTFVFDNSHNVYGPYRELLMSECPITYGVLHGFVADSLGEKAAATEPYSNQKTTANLLVQCGEVAPVAIKTLARDAPTVSADVVEPKSLWDLLLESLVNTGVRFF